jgi:hypothetical protein
MLLSLKGGVSGNVGVLDEQTYQVVYRQRIVNSGKTQRQWQLAIHLQTKHRAIACDGIKAVERSWKTTRTEPIIALYQRQISFAITTPCPFFRRSERNHRHSIIHFKFLKGSWHYVPLGIQSHESFWPWVLEKISNESAAPANDTRALHGQSLEMTDTLTLTDVKERAVVHGSEKMLWRFLNWYSTDHDCCCDMPASQFGALPISRLLLPTVPGVLGNQTVML